MGHLTLARCRYNSVTTKHLIEFSEQGLRTLCLAFREISAEEVNTPSPALDFGLFVDAMPHVMMCLRPSLGWLFTLKPVWHL